MHTVVRFEVVRARRTREFLEEVATALSGDERVEGVTVEDEPERGSLPWLRVPTATGHVEVWNGAGAADAVATGSPVAFHPRYHVLAAGAARFNVLV